MQNFPVRVEYFDLSNDAEVVDDPVKEVTGSVGQLHDSPESFVPVKDKFFDCDVLIDTFEQSEQLSGLTDCL